MPTPWLGIDDAVYEPLNVPRSVWLQRSRTVAAPVGIPRALHCTVIEALAEPRLRSATARTLVPDSALDHTCRFVPGDAARRPCWPRESWSTAMTSVLVSVALLVALMLPRSFPAMSGAENIAHMLKCVRPSVSDRPLLPTSNMSGSFQCPAPAYGDSAASMSMRRVISPHVALMSAPMRHMFAMASRSSPQVEVCAPVGSHVFPLKGLML